MRLILEKLSGSWQLRFLSIASVVLLVAYAVVLPVHSDESVNRDVIPVLNGAERVSETLAANALRPTPVAAARVAVAPASASIWIGENSAAAAQFSLVAQSYVDSNLPIDYSESVRQLRTRAEGGDVAAQFLLGHAYEAGLGVPKDMTETVRWYTRATDVSGGANEALAESGAKSGTVPGDFGQAFEVYREAAVRGDAAAQLYLGLSYDQGRDVARSVAQAAYWYRKAAAQGSASAEENLGILYSKGDGMPKDSVEAAHWFDRAAGQGNAHAQYSLGRMYFAGDGVVQSYPEAAHWLSKAAQQGSAPAQVLLSDLYATGRGVAGDYATAYMWLNLASARDDKARESREQVEKLVTADERAEGQRLTHGWLIQHPLFMH